MAKQPHGKLNQLERDLPEGLLVDAGWLSGHGYSTSLRSQYVTAGWLQQPTRRVYRRSRSPLTWQQVVVSLQSLLQYDLVVGGRTALEHLGFVHYLSPNTSDVHLYGPKAPPKWLTQLNVGVQFYYHNERKLFRTQQPASSANTAKKAQHNDAPPSERVVIVNVGWSDEWPLKLSTPERAILEMLDELPARESFHHLDKIMEGLANLSPRRLQELLVDCRNVKVKRLFFFFAERHNHAWLKHLNKSAIDFGKGKRMLVKGGKLDHRYQITVPEKFDAV
jgi:hypothetical protein